MLLLKSFLYLTTFLTCVLALPSRSHSRHHVPSQYLSARGVDPISCSKGRKAPSPACCVWYEVLDHLQEDLFSGGQCLEEAHEVSLTFHDAIGYSQSLTLQGEWGGGGADGSIMHHLDVEGLFPPNEGMDNIVEAQRSIALRYHVSYADMIQFAGAVGASNCRGAPRLEFLAGRPNSSFPSPEGLLPDVAGSAESILARMADAGFTPNDLVDLLASHSIAAQDDIDKSIPGSPFDSTPYDFDARFFAETLLEGNTWPGDGPHDGEEQSPLAGEFRLHSDYVIARHPETACRWQSFITDQNAMMDRFKEAMSKLAIVGQNRNSLYDCSPIIPIPAPPLAQVVTLPAGKTNEDIQAACSATPFPTLSSDPGAYISGWRFC
ncbi:heme peroxidase [Pluteus cervinus]|uniref:Heme peroxidase n=1 Tax=Pluteus cervinus TaxID=181527 RepID=A0ACD3AHS9_9AGAR|nr:heme peroxidase [Pluteus cervinus]